VSDINDRLLRLRREVKEFASVWRAVRHTLASFDETCLALFGDMRRSHF
jgi:hypothetical protein